jgi:hypothetical protein
MIRAESTPVPVLSSSELDELGFGEARRRYFARRRSLSTAKGCCDQLEDLGLIAGAFHFEWYDRTADFLAGRRLINSLFTRDARSQLDRVWLAIDEVLAEGPGRHTTSIELSMEANHEWELGTAALAADADPLCFVHHELDTAAYEGALDA